MTIEIMAKELGVSISTVSRALSGKGRIGEQTRKRVIEYAKEHELTEKLEKHQAPKTGNLGVVLPSDVYVSSEPYFQECMLGICETAALMNYDVLITTMKNSDISGIQNLVEKNKVDGIILTRNEEKDNAISYLTRQNFPVALTGACNNANVIQVDIDNEGATEALTSHLISVGYRKFALLVADMSFSVDTNRYNGFCKALVKHGIDRDKQVVYTSAGGMDTMMDSIIGTLMAQKVECVICGDDVICTKIVSKLQSERYRIPKDIGVASLYNSINLNCFTPPITTVSVSASQIGNMICAQMIRYLNGMSYQDQTVVDYEILVRKSTSIL